MSESEFSHILKLDEIGGTRKIALSADDAECRALAKRFGLLALKDLTANAELYRDGEAVRVSGIFSAKVAQACIASGEPVPEDISEELNLIFIPNLDHAPDAEIELSSDECESIFHDGKSIDLGEAVAQSVALALNPYPRSDGAEEALRTAGVKSEEEEREESGPFAALAELKAKE